MIDLTTCGRIEFIEHEANLQGYIKHLEEEVNILNEKLQKYEGPQLTKKELTEEFERLFWNIYEKKGNKKTSFKKWSKLTKKNKELVVAHVPKYVKATPNKAFRKNAETYFNQEVWNDELPEVTDNYGNKEPVRSYATPEPKAEEVKRLKKAKQLRNKNRGMSVKDRLNL